MSAEAEPHPPPRDVRPGSAAAVVLVDIRATALSVDEVLAAVRTPAAGGIALFVGAVRSQDGGRNVAALGYAEHPSALSELRRVAEAVAAAHSVVRLAAVHRTGELRVGDLAVVVAAACHHRNDAFAACRQLIDDLKASVPIWKHQRFADGTEEWVGSP